MSETAFRGSRKHLLDLLDRVDRLDILGELLAQYGVCFAPSSQHQPRGHEAPEEWTLRAFCEAHCVELMDYESFDRWWVPDEYKNPTWDLLSLCSIDGRRGLLLVEAKAHESELDWGPKQLPPAASEQSRKNHLQICRCIDEARAWLNDAVGDVNISAESHYQLSNRVASAWKLAACGLPAVLLYLGFVGDACFADYFVDADHWQRTVGGYMHGLLPQSLPGRKLHHPSGGLFLMLVKSLPVTAVAG